MLFRNEIGLLFLLLRRQSCDLEMFKFGINRKIVVLFYNYVMKY